MHIAQRQFCFTSWGTHWGLVLITDLQRPVGIVFLWQTSCELSSEKTFMLSDSRDADFSQSCSWYGFSDHYFTLVLGLKLLLSFKGYDSVTEATSFCNWLKVQQMKEITFMSVSACNCKFCQLLYSKAMAKCTSTAESSCWACILKPPCQLSSLDHMDCMHMWIPEIWTHHIFVLKKKNINLSL